MHWGLLLWECASHVSTWMTFLLEEFSHSHSSTWHLLFFLASFYFRYQEFVNMNMSDGETLISLVRSSRLLIDKTNIVMIHLWETASGKKQNKWLDLVREKLPTGLHNSFLRIHYVSFAHCICFIPYPYILSPEDQAPDFAFHDPTDKISGNLAPDFVAVWLRSFSMWQRLYLGSLAANRIMSVP